MGARIGLGAIVATTLLLAFAGCPRAQTPDALPADVAFGRYVAIIRADIGTGDELVRRRAWEVAHRHFMFPLEEVYGVIRDELHPYKTPPFDGALRTLARTVKAHDTRRYPKALRKVEDALAAADAGLKVRQPDWPSFIAQVAVATLQTAPDEYDDAVVNGRIARPISYQVARGYILEAARMIESIAADLADKNPEALRDIRDNFAQLKQAFASVNAPKHPPLDVPAVADRVSRIAAAAAKLKTT